MKRKLLLLNLLLAALCALCAWRLRQGWEAARNRERAVLGAPQGGPRPNPGAATPAPPALASANYLDVAQKFLFSKDRNSNVVLDVAPPKVMPQLPLLYGVMLFTAPPTVILSEKADAPNRGYRPGDRIGPFKLLAVNSKTIEFEWDGQKVVRGLDEIRAKAGGVQQAAQVAEAPPPPQAGPSNVITPASSSGPGLEIGGGLRACGPGDSAAPGTISNGYRKVVSDTPFGKACRWEQVK
jgi:hypothetical protein